MSNLFEGRLAHELVTLIDPQVFISGFYRGNIGWGNHPARKQRYTETHFKGDGGDDAEYDEADGGRRL